MSFGEIIFLAILGLLVFGPRKLPEVARTLAKIMAELRKASNEFRYSLEEEIRVLDVKERAEKRAALPASPPPPVVEGAVARPAFTPPPPALHPLQSMPVDAPSEPPAGLEPAPPPA